MITLNYTYMAEPMADKDALRFAEKVARAFDSNQEFNVANELAIHAVCALVAVGKIDIAKRPIMVQQDGIDVGQIKEDGSFDNNRPGFCNLASQLQLTRLDARMKKRCESFTEEDDKRMKDFINNWLVENVQEVLSPGTKVLVDVACTNKPDLLDVSKYPTAEIKEWVKDEEQNRWFVVFTDGKQVPGDAAPTVLYDMTGARYIAKTWGQADICKALGIEMPFEGF